MKAAELTGTVGRVAEYLRSSSPSQRQLRKTLREWKIWDKARTPAFLDFLKVKDSDETIEPGPFLSHYLSIVDETERRTLIFQFIRDQNPILVKSIFDALDTERDGRIQSTNELYRMVTSYIYPGEHISLPDFQYWVTWMHGIDVLRTIGLRWGLGDVGSVYAEEIRQLDMEEILEDLEEGLTSDWEEMPDIPPASPEAETTEPEEQAEPAAEMVAEQPEPSKPQKKSRGSSTKLAAGKPAKAKPEHANSVSKKERAEPTVQATTPTTAPKVGKTRSIEPASPPPAPTLPVTLAPIFVRGSTQTMVSLTEKEITANAETIQNWWESYTFRSPFRAKDFGLSLEGQDEGPHTLTELCVTALFVPRDEGAAARDARSLSALPRNVVWDIPMSHASVRTGRDSIYVPKTMQIL